MKPISTPKKVKILDALTRRLPSDHKSYNKVKNDFGKFNAGYIGEKSLEYFLEKLQKENTSYYMI
jgi:hypothetical protein